MVNMSKHRDKKMSKGYPYWSSMNDEKTLTSLDWLQLARNTIIHRYSETAVSIYSMQQYKSKLKMNTKQDT